MKSKIIDAFKLLIVVTILGLMLKGCLHVLKTDSERREQSRRTIEFYHGNERKVCREAREYDGHCGVTAECEGGQMFYCVGPYRMISK